MLIGSVRGLLRRTGVEVAGGSQARPRLGTQGGGVPRAQDGVGETVEPVHGTIAAVGNEADLLGLTGFEAHRTPGVDVQVAPEGRGAVEAKPPVGLEEVEM